MNVITKSIQDLHFKIPPQILDLVFIRRSRNWTLENVSVDDAILETVVRPRVCVDCDLVGGKECTISLAGVPMEKPDDFTSVYHIPKTKTQGRSILSLLNISYNDPTRAASYGATNTLGSSTLMRAAQSMMDSVGSIPVTSTSNITLIAENTVLVRDYILFPTNAYLRCRLANDENMSNIHPRSYLAFSKLIELAVKSYIYNESVVRIDMGQIVAGNQIGTIKDIIDGYSDAEEMYHDHLKNVIGKVSFMNDTETMQRHIRSMIGPYR